MTKKELIPPADTPLPNEYIGIGMDGTRNDIKTPQERREPFFTKDGTPKPLGKPARIISRAD